MKDGQMSKGVEEQQLCDQQQSVGSTPSVGQGHAQPPPTIHKKTPGLENPLLQQTNHRIQQLAARLDQLQANLDLWGRASDAAQSFDPPTRATGSRGFLLVGGFLLVALGVAAGVVYEGKFAENAPLTLPKMHGDSGSHAANLNAQTVQTASSTPLDPEAFSDLDSEETQGGQGSEAGGRKGAGTTAAASSAASPVLSSPATPASSPADASGASSAVTPSSAPASETVPSQPRISEEFSTRTTAQMGQEPIEPASTPTAVTVAAAGSPAATPEEGDAQQQMQKTGESSQAVLNPINGYLRL